MADLHILQGILQKRGDGTLIYVIGLQDSARIAAHSSLNYQGFHIVKIRVQ